MLGEVNALRRYLNRLGVARAWTINAMSAEVDRPAMRDVADSIYNFAACDVLAVCPVDQPLAAAGVDV